MPPQQRRSSVTYGREPFHPTKDATTGKWLCSICGEYKAAGMHDLCPDCDAREDGRARARWRHSKTTYGDPDAIRPIHMTPHATRDLLRSWDALVNAAAFTEFGRSLTDPSPIDMDRLTNQALNELFAALAKVFYVLDPIIREVRDTVGIADQINALMEGTRRPRGGGRVDT